MPLSLVPLVVLSAVNLVPLVGVAVFDWNFKTLVALYWLENGFVGLYALPQLFLAKERGALGKSKGYQIIFYVTHYSTFFVMHGALIVYVLFGTDVPFEGNAIVFAVALFLLFGSHGVSLGVNFWMGRQFERANALKLSVLPYARVVPAHAFLAIAALAFGPDASVVLLGSIVLAKLIIDAVTYWSIQNWFRRQPVAEVAIPGT